MLFALVCTRVILRIGKLFTQGARETVWTAAFACFVGKSAMRATIANGAVGCRAVEDEHILRKSNFPHQHTETFCLTRARPYATVDVDWRRAVRRRVNPVRCSLRHSTRKVIT